VTSGYGRQLVGNPEDFWAGNNSWQYTNSIWHTTRSTFIYPVDSGPKSLLEAIGVKSYWLHVLVKPGFAKPSGLDFQYL